jgi:hypothetical protein
MEVLLKEINLSFGLLPKMMTNFSNSDVYRHHIKKFPTHQDE